MIVPWIGAAVCLLGIAGMLFPYLGYPLYLRLRRDARSRGIASEAPWRPGVTIVVAAYNEAAGIREKLENLLAQRYEGERQIVVASDASDDGTDAIVSEFADRGVELLRMSERGGKSLAQNAAVERARHEVLIFTDASVLLDGGAIEALVDELSDPTVGAVSGEDVSVSAAGGDPAEGAGFYTRFEIAVRRLEERKFGTLIGVSGCLFAVRAHLRSPVPPEAVDDFAVPLHVVARGFRVTATPRARAFVRRAAGIREEYRRKVRTFTGAMFTWSHAVRVEDAVGLDRARRQAYFHKWARWCGPLFAAAALAGNALALPLHPVLILLLLLQFAAWTTGAAWNGYLARRAHAGAAQSPGPRNLLFKIAKLAGFFALVQAALAAAWWRYLRGRSYAVWAPTRRAA